MYKLRTILTWGLLLAAAHVMGYTITVSPIEIEAGQSTNLIINLNNTETNLTAYQMFIDLPEGVTVQKKANGKYKFTANADRHDGNFTISVQDEAAGRILIACFSADKDVLVGTSGELIRLPIDVASTVTTSLQGSIEGIEFSDVNNQPYNISDVDFTMTVEEGDAQTLALASLPAMTYGNAAYTLPATTAENLTLTWTSSNTAVVTISGNVLTIKGAGTATITATNEGNNDYLPFSKEYTLTVAKAALTITADDKSKQQGEANPELTVSYSSFVYDEDASVLTTQPTVTTTATTDSPAGTYPITASGAASANYDITYVSGTLTVTEGPVVIEVTDISQLDNAIYIEPVEAFCGDQKVLSIKMKNNVAIQTIQFDLYLPEGLTVVANEDDELITASKERIRKFNYFNSSIQSDGALRLLAQATTTNVPAGDGEICTITVNVSEDMEEGDYPLVFKGIRMTEQNNTNYAPNPNIVQTKLTIFSYILGDANGDRDVDAIDFNMIANDILGYSQSDFNKRAADINGDGDVDAIDFNMIANKILYGSFSGIQSSMEPM